MAAAEASYLSRPPVRVVHSPDRVRAALARELRDAGAVPPPIDVTPLPAIARDAGHGAKLKLIRKAAPHA